MTKTAKTPAPEGAAPETVSIENLSRSVQVRASTVDEEARTVEVTWTTGAAVPRYMPGLGRVMEELDVSKSAIRMDRLNNGAPFLNTHSDWSLRDVIGVVEKAWIEGAEGRALIRFSERDEVEPIWRDVRGGIIRNVSVGYRVHRYEVIEGADGETTRVRALDWEPFEISAVPIGADDQAGFRAADTGKIEHPCILERAEPGHPKKETQMTKTVIDDTGAAITDDANTRANGNPPAAPAEPNINADAVRAEARQAERERVSAIQLMGRKHKIDQDDIDSLINDDKTVDQARAFILDKLADADDKPGEIGARFGGQDEVGTRRSLVISAIEHRLNPKAELMSGAADFRNLSLLEIAKDLLAARGEQVRGLSRSEIARMALRSSHSTSDFPYILANVASKRLQMAYDAAPQTFRPIVNEVTLPDFKTTSVVALSDAPAFVQKLEGAEYTYGTVGENREQYALATYGRAIRFTDEMLINDDLRAFDRMVTMFGRSAANFESDLVWGVITANAALSDGKALFHTDHGNLVSAGAINITNLGAASAAMRNQKTLAPSATEDGQLMNLTPSFLAVPAELQTVALQYTRSTTIPNDPAYANVYAGTITPIIEPRLASLSGGSTDDWYLFASPAEVDMIDFAGLEGEGGPVIFQETDFDTDAVKLKARLRRAAKAIDYRGMVKNPGS